MTKHAKVYLDFFGLTTEDFIGCEVCHRRAVDLHHIIARGMGGTTTHDEIENIMALCRECHLQYGDKKQHIEMLQARHDSKVHYHLQKW